MKKMQKWGSLALCICLLLGAALAEAPVEVQAAPETVATEPSVATNELADDTILATVNGKEVRWSSAKSSYQALVGEYGSYYDLTDPAMVNMFRSYAMEKTISFTLIMQEAEKAGLGLTDEENTASDKEADEIWASAISNYITGNFSNLTEASTPEEKAQAQAAAEAYYGEIGYNQEVLRTEMRENKLYNKLFDQVTQDAAVTDADVEAKYQSKVETDKAQFENDLAGYVEYNAYVQQSNAMAQMYGQPSQMEHAWYKPAGFRQVKHILLQVDPELLAKYKDLQSKLEEQMEAEAAAEAAAAETAAPAPEAAAEAAVETAAPEAAAPEATSVPVTQADVDNAKADILASLADKINEINQKITDGVAFDELITAYGTDPGMQNEKYMTTGYDVARESMDYYPEFVEAAFSVDSIGDVSAPYLTDVGVHIVKYIGDAPAGPISMTEEERVALGVSLLEAMKEEKFAAKLDEWKAASTITYTDAVPSIAQLEAAAAAEAEEPEEMVAEGLEAETTEAPAQEAPEVTPVP